MLGLAMSTIAACASSRRLRILPTAPSDSARLNSSRSGEDSEVFRFIPQLAVPFRADTWLAEAHSNTENDIRHIVRRSEDMRAIGYVQINRRRNAELELGYWLGKPYWGMRFGLEASALALSLFGRVAGRSKIFAAVAPENVPSIRILTTLGFVQNQQAIHNHGYLKE